MLSSEKVVQGPLCPMCQNSSGRKKGVVQNFLFLECPQCELIFAPEISPDYLQELYSSGFHGPEDGAPEIGWSKNISFLNPAFEVLKKKEGLTILDFGTGQGLIPDVLREQGNKVIAVDIAPPLRPHPDRYTGDLISLGLPSGKFDLVFSFQVFEHLPHPRPILEELIRLTKPGGLILIHTDMETEERCNGDFTDWWYVAPPDHCIFYRHKTFEHFLDQTGHSIIWKDSKSIIIQKES